MHTRSWLRFAPRALKKKFCLISFGLKTDCFSVTFLPCFFVLFLIIDNSLKEFSLGNSKPVTWVDNTEKRETFGETLRKEPIRIVSDLLDRWKQNRTTGLFYKRLFGCPTGQHSETTGSHETLSTCGKAGRGTQILTCFSPSAKRIYLFWSIIWHLHAPLESERCSLAAPFTVLPPVTLAKASKSKDSTLTESN